MIKKITLDFFGEKVRINCPKDLSSLRSKISQEFLLGASDVAEIIITYNDGNDKTLIENEESYKLFVESKSLKIDLSISENSQIYKQTLESIKKEENQDDKELENLIKKDEELKKLINEILAKERKKITEIDNKIDELTQLKITIIRKNQEEILRLQKQINENKLKVLSVQKNFEIPKETANQKISYNKMTLRKNKRPLQNRVNKKFKINKKNKINSNQTKPENSINQKNDFMQAIDDWAKYIQEKTIQVTDTIAYKFKSLQTFDLNSTKNEQKLKAGIRRLASERITQEVPYEYKNCPIPGGGFVTGFLFDSVDNNVMYIRTDIGGIYRYDRKQKKFISLINDVTMEDLSRTFPMTFTTKEGQKGSLIAAGGMDGKNGRLWISDDYGETFIEKELPVCCHGNWNGRGTGERIVVFENFDIILASPRNGLFITKNKGNTWKELDVNGEKHFSFIFKRPDTDTIIVATAGITTKKNNNLRGHSLYISYDRGENFEEVDEPFIEKMNYSKMTGFVGHRYDYDGKALYITMNHTGERAYIVEPGYTCDCGHVVGGVLLKYTFDEDGKISTYENVAPVKDFKTLDYGYGGVSISKHSPGLMVLSTITREKGDIIYRSYDYGKTWENILEGLREGEIRFNAPYMRPECNGNDSLIHWLSHIVINPYNDDEVWFNTGTGVFKTDNFKDGVPVFFDHCNGIEETVHLNLYAPTDGTDVQLIDILGDLGGFAFLDVDIPCDNSFADDDGNRYITCINADYSDKDPNVVIVTPRGNWTGKTKGGLIMTKDGCKTFDRVKMPFGLSTDLDKHLYNIENPNVNSGWVALSPDTKNIVWSVADGINLPKNLVIYSNDGGASFKFVKIPKCEDTNFKVYSDRVDSELFYGFTEKGNFFVSHDKGASFELIDTNDSFKGVHFGLIDTANKTEIRVESGKTGVIYLACNSKGLWKLEYSKETKKAVTKQLSEDGDVVYRLGLGIIEEGADYLKTNKAIYICAKIGREYGFYRSFDDGKTYERINTEKQMYGEINSLDADKRTFGRFYIATGSRGVLYGEPKKEEEQDQ